jgi:hypothetical protein
MNKRTIILILIGVAAIASIIVLLIGGFEPKGRNLVILVDTSASMVGVPDGPDIFDDVKKSLSSLIGGCRRGDEAYILRFDEDVGRVASVAIRDEDRDLETLHSRVDALKAEGDYTFMALGLKRTLQVADSLTKKNPDHSMVAVLYSDGRNNPPPDQRIPENFDLQAIADLHRDNPWFVYYISLGTEPDSELVNAVDKFKQGETKESVEAKDLPDRTEEILEDTWRGRVLHILQYIAAIIGCLIVAAILLLLIKRWKEWETEKLVGGRLEYFDKSSPERKSRADLVERSTKLVTIGTETSDMVVVPAVAGKTGRMAKIRNRNEEGIGVPYITAEPGFMIRHRNIDVQELRLYDRDEFDIGEIHFIYRNGELPRRKD